VFSITIYFTFLEVIDIELMANFSISVVLSVLVVLCSVTADLVDTDPSEGKG
jgi:hypothetical protein